MRVSNVKITVLVGFLCFVCWPALLRGQLSGGMIDPSIDKPGEPFCYFWHPTDVVGTLYAPVASEITPEGYVYTGFGELMFFVGNPPVPVNQRLRTLYEDKLPIVQYHFEDKGVRYSFTILAVDLGSELEGLPVNLVKVELQNISSQKRTPFLTSAFRVKAPRNRLQRAESDYRFRQRFDLIPHGGGEAQAAFNPRWKYWLESYGLLRDDRVIYTFPTDPPPYQKSITENDSGFRQHIYLSGEVEGNPFPDFDGDPQTPMGMVMYRCPLNPGQSQQLIFKIPVVPVHALSPESALVQAADFDQGMRETVDFWIDLVVKKSPFSFPEAKVQDALIANTIFDLMAIDKVGDEYIVNVNKTHYHYFYPTDSSLMNVSLDDMGFAAITAKTLLHVREVANTRRGTGRRWFVGNPWPRVVGVGASLPTDPR